MIVSPRGDRLLMVRQVDHQEQCGRMAAAWGNAAFARLDPWEPVVVAAGCHDEGWRAFDDAPEAGPDGRPVDFPDLDRGRHVALFSAGIDAAVTRDARAGLLVSMHGQGLHTGRLGLDGDPPPPERLEPAVRTFVREQEELRARVRAAIGDPRLDAWCWDGYRVLQAVDVLSLYLLWLGLPRGARGALARVPRGPGDAGVDVVLTPDGDGVCRLTPYPFAEPEVAFPVPARWIPNRRYASSEDLRDALSGAAWDTVVVAVRGDVPAA
ncbi:MAG: DUF3891 family protein [Actinomycetota bacterium]